MRRPSAKLTAVYPRLRGGSTYSLKRRVCQCGLSPPTRGIRWGWAHEDGPIRSIPAYAGDPTSTRRLPRGWWVYPRLRGGSRLRSSSSLSSVGLSPPTRGIQIALPQPLPRIGSIPAYAGDPDDSGIITNAIEVYPRLRGGSALLIGWAISTTGLSPPTRGIQPAPPAPTCTGRSIPAYAGDPTTHVHHEHHNEVYPRLRGGSIVGWSSPSIVMGLSPPTRGIPAQE